MNINQILKYLNLDYRSSSEFEINYISTPSQEVEETVMFINKLSYNPLDYILSKHCLILISSEVASKYDIKLKFTQHPDSKSIILIMDDPKFSIYRIITDLKINKIYGNIDHIHNEYYYMQLESRSEYVDETAKVMNTITGIGCQFQHGCVVGFDDFCPIPVPNSDKLVMFPQLGDVIIGEDVYIGMYSSVGRGTLGSTTIGDQTKIDAYCQVGHNCQLGRRIFMAAGTILSGGVQVGDDTAFGIGVRVTNGVKIGNNVTIGAGAVVTKDIPNNWIVAGVPAKKIGENAPDREVGYVFG